MPGSLEWPPLTSFISLQTSHRWDSGARSGNILENLWVKTVGPILLTLILPNGVNRSLGFCLCCSALWQVSLYFSRQESRNSERFRVSHTSSVRLHELITRTRRRKWARIYHETKRQFLNLQNEQNQKQTSFSQHQITLPRQKSQSTRTRHSELPSTSKITDACLVDTPWFASVTARAALLALLRRASDERKLMSTISDCRFHEARHSLTQRSGARGLKGAYSI